MNCAAISGSVPSVVGGIMQLREDLQKEIDREVEMRMDILRGVDNNLRGKDMPFESALDLFMEAVEEEIKDLVTKWRIWMAKANSPVSENK